MLPMIKIKMVLNSEQKSQGIRDMGIHVASYETEAIKEMMQETIKASDGSVENK